MKGAYEIMVIKNRTLIFIFTILLSGCYSINSSYFDFTPVFEAPENELLTSFRWSFQGNRMAINTLQPNNATRTIFILNLDLGHFEQLNSSTYVFEAWSPDENTIAIWSPVSNGLMQLDLVELTVIDDVLEGESIAWSPNGTYIAVLNYRNNYPNLFVELSIADNEKTIIATKTLTGDNDHAFASSPSWSADSSILVFRWDKDLTDHQSGIYLFDLAMNIVTPLTTNGFNTSPTWLLNQYVAYLRESNSGFGKTIELVNINSGCNVSIPISTDVDQISVSPDSTKIAILEDRSIWISTTAKLIEYIENECK